MVCSGDGAQHLDFLQKLGVTAVYFSPLFESDTHGYDTADYFQIDKRLGDVKLFKQVVDQCHQRDIKVVLDGVFNHTGRRHFAFQDLEANGPEKSEYRNWYILGARSEDYEGWCNVDEGPFGFSYDCWEVRAERNQSECSRRCNAVRPSTPCRLRCFRLWLHTICMAWLTESGRAEGAPQLQRRKSCESYIKDFGWEIAHAAVTRRPPISLNTIVDRTGGYTYDVGVCPSFKGHFLSRRAKP